MVRVLRENTRQTDLTARLTALERVIDLCDGRLPATTLASARGVVTRADERLRLSLDQTTVAFGGPTGTGKSSLFNALVGIGLSPVGIRRPTTVTTVACVWDPLGMHTARPLLDRIGVPHRQQLSRRSALDRSGPDDLTGLILLDLPDYDSAAPQNRSEVDQVVDLADAMVWVTDPQKYADATWHQRYLRNLTHHADVQVIVLNQIDKLPPEDVGVCVEDLTRLLASDGLAEVEVIACSARTGAGIGRLRSLLTELVTSRAGAMERLAADVDRAVEDLTEDCLGPVSLASHGGPADDLGGVCDEARETLVSGLADAAGIGLLAETVAEAHATHAVWAASSPVAKLWRNARSGPRLQMRLPRLARVGAEPAPVPLQPTAARAAIGTMVSRVAEGLPRPWADAVSRVGEASTSGVVATLDDALSGTAVAGARVSMWWSLAGVVQWLLTFTVLVGVSGAAAWPFLHGRRLPQPAGMPLPYWLLGGAVICSVALSVWCRAAARRAGARRHAVVATQLRERVAEAAEDAVVEPVERELAVFRAMHEAFSTARSR